MSDIKKIAPPGRKGSSKATKSVSLSLDDEKSIHDNSQDSQQGFVEKQPDFEGEQKTSKKNLIQKDESEFLNQQHQDDVEDEKSRSAMLQQKEADALRKQKLEEGQINATEAKNRDGNDALAIQQKKELDERQKRAAEKLAKQMAFLNEMEQFSVDFEEKTSTKEMLLKESKDKEKESLLSSVQQQQSLYVAPIAISTRDRLKDETFNETIQNDHSRRDIEKEEISVVHVEHPVVIQEPMVENTNSSFNQFASILFSDKNMQINSNANSKVEAQNVDPPNQEVLRVPQKFAAMEKNIKNDDTKQFLVSDSMNGTLKSTQVTNGETSYSANQIQTQEVLKSPSNFAGAANSNARIKSDTNISAKSASLKEGVKDGIPTIDPSTVTLHIKGNVEINSDDEESDITRVSSARVEGWKAKQNHLNTYRQEFGGSVVFAFNGVFAWQMYSSVEAGDPSGSTYTEYLMRCQWGPSWDFMSPWLVARRYREFDNLDSAIRNEFGESITSRLLPLPEKKYFGSLSSETIEERKTMIEAYMVHIVTKMPEVLKSKAMNIFLDISTRVEVLYANYLKIEADIADIPTDPFIKLTLEQIWKEDDALRIPEPLSHLNDEALLRDIEKMLRDYKALIDQTKKSLILKSRRVKDLFLACQSKWPVIKELLNFALSPHATEQALTLLPRVMHAEDNLKYIINEMEVLLLHELAH